MLIVDREPREFFVWVSPNSWLVQHNLGLIGGFFGGPLTPGADTPDHLQFVPNPNPQPGSVSPFHNGIINHYRVEYNLEIQRYHSFREYPSRLHALYLLASRDAAYSYQETHPDHVSGRVLKRGVTNGPYKFSTHDASWIDFMRLGHSMDDETTYSCAQSYWTGIKTTDVQLVSMGRPWSATSVEEVLFYGRLDFPNRDLNVSD